MSDRRWCTAIQITFSSGALGLDSCPLVPGHGGKYDASSENRGPLGIEQFTPLPSRQIAQRETADPDPNQSQRRMSDRRGHPADLAVFSLGEFERDPAVGNAFAETDWRIAWCNRRRGLDPTGAAGTRAKITEFDFAALESREGGGIRDAFDLRPVFAIMTVLRIEELRVEAGLVGKQQETLRIGVEPAQRVNGFRQREFRERPPARAWLRRELREHAVGFVESEEQV
jgi:hypothetical protein